MHDVILTDTIDDVRCLRHPDWLLDGDGDPDLGQREIGAKIHGQGGHGNGIIFLGVTKKYAII